MSHHLDTPEAAERGQLFIDDLFVFGTASTTTFVLDVNSTVTGSSASPDFWPGARYELKAHVDGSEREQVTFRVTFGEPEDGGQSVRLEVLGGDAASDDASTGTVLLEGRTGQVLSADGVRLWAGRAADPFYFDLSVLSPVSTSLHEGSALDLSSFDPSSAENTFGGTTVASIVLEVPHGTAGLTPGAQLGVWAATRLRDGDGWRQVNRGGLPMMWPIIWTDDTDFSDPANRRHPSQDEAEFAGQLGEMVAASVGASGTAQDPQAYGRQVAAQVLPDVLPYEVGSAAAFTDTRRNGRALTDNAPAVMLSLFAGRTVDVGLDASAAASARAADFPYVVPA